MRKAPGLGTSMQRLESEGNPQSLSSLHIVQGKKSLAHGKLQLWALGWCMERHKSQFETFYERLYPLTDILRIELVAVCSKDELFLELFIVNKTSPAPFTY